jgi:hypothetical protein
MDEPNLVPMFNSFAWSASLIKKFSVNKESVPQDLNLPCNDQNFFKETFPDAGLLIDRGPEYYSVINYRKGGVVQHYENSALKILNTGVVFKNSLGKLGSNQSFNSDLKYKHDGKKILIRNQVTEMPKQLPSCLQFLLLRICCFTIFRSSLIRELTKRFLVKYLITKPKKWPFWNEREIILGKSLEIQDKHQEVKGFTKLETSKPFVAIHMASKGYWQIQDEAST